MSRSLFSVLVIVLVLAACGTQPPAEESDLEVSKDAMPDDDLHRMAAEMPDDDVHTTAMAEGMGVGMSGLNTEINLDPSIVSAWSGIRVRVIDGEETQHFDIGLGETVELGDTGLTLSAHTFIPDFVMDDDGITSRSPEANNPAARVVISEEGAVYADTRVVHLTVNGTFDGNLWATGELHVLMNGKCHGRVTCSNLVVEAGGVLNAEVTYATRQGAGKVVDTRKRLLDQIVNPISRQSSPPPESDPTPSGPRTADE